MKKNLVLLLTISLFFNKIKGQQSLTLYNNEFIPQSNYVNPSTIPFSKINIGIPGISSIYFNFTNNGFKYNDLIKKGSDDSLHIDMGNLISKLKKNNYIGTAVQLDLISFGFKVKKNYFSFNLTPKLVTRFSYPKGFMQFVWEGNGNHLDEDLNFNFGFNLSAYHELGVGYARELNDKLTVGGRLKYLRGIVNVSTKKSDIIMHTSSQQNFPITLSSDIDVNISGLDTAGKPKPSISGAGNSGLGIDMGATYKFSDKLVFTASLIDLGFINWKQEVTNYRSKQAGEPFTFSGVDINKFFGDTTGSAFDDLLDSLKKTFELTTTHEKYKTALTSQFYLGGNYIINKNNKAGVVIYGSIFKKRYSPGLSLQYNLRVKKWFSVMANYSIYNRSFANGGLGFSINAGPVQWYFISDNVFGPVFPQSAKNIHLHFGMNLTFGRKIKEEAPAKF